MITADDYNNYLYTQSDNIRKIKSINRTHSGHSRYVDLRDPTGAYKNLNLFGTDGTLKMEKRVKISYATAISAESAFESYIKPLIADDELINLYYSQFRGTFDAIADSSARTDGWIEDVSNITQANPARITTSTAHEFTNGTLVKFQGFGASTGMGELNNKSYYVKRIDAYNFDIYIDSTYNNSPVDSTSFTTYISGGIVTSDELKYVWQQIGTTSTGYIIDSDAEIKRIGETQTGFLRYLRVGSLVKFKAPDDTEIWAKLSKSFGFGTGVDGLDGNPSGLTSDGSYGAISLDKVIPDNSVIEVIYPSYARQFTSTEKNAIINFLKAKQTFALKYDYINVGWDIIDNDPLPSQANTLFPGPFTYTPSATPDNNWLIHINYDTTSLNDKWDITLRTIRYTLDSEQIAFSNITDELQLNEKSNKAQRDIITITNAKKSSMPSSQFYIYGYKFVTNGDQSGVYDNSSVILALVDSNADARPEDPYSFDTVTYPATSDNTGYGSSFQDKLRFEWTHIPSENQILDPSYSNIIDVFVLTRTFDTAYRNWLKSTRDDLQQPLVPTINELNSSFKQQANRKAMSDSIIYRPVNYKVLFGPKADATLQAKFRVIKMPETIFTDNEIKEKVVDSITNFFNIDNWDFGETFYFTELAAYVHKELSGIVSSFVIVPQGSGSVFGDLFQIKPNGDQLLIPDVGVNDIDIIDNITSANIRSAS